MHDRIEAPRILLPFQAHVEHLLDTKIKCVQSDWGGEYQKIHKTFFVLLELLIVFCALTHINKMGLLNASTVILLKLA